VRPMLACGVAFAAVVLFFLIIYPLKNYRYPTGWDSAFYVWRARSVGAEGLRQIGSVRAAMPLLGAVLMRATGQNAFTIVAVLPAVMAGILGLAAAAMVRMALRISVVWVPVIALMTWVAFGWNGMMGGHLDNVVNAAFVVCGFAAAVALVARGRGALAAAILFMAAALAVWPFYLFAMAVYGLGIVLFAWPAISARLSGRSHSLAEFWPLAAAGAASAGFAALTFLSPPPGGGLGVRVGGPGIKGLLKERFLLRVREPARYYAFPLAAVGAWVAGKEPAPPASRPGRRLFLSLMAAWLTGTLLAGLAQVVNVPVAGGRLLHFFFPVPILAGVCLWWAARWLARRYGKTGAMAGGLAVLAVVAGFGALAWNGGADRKPWVETKALQQVGSAGLYVHSYAADRDVVYLIDTGLHDDGATLGRWWSITQAALPPEQLDRAHVFFGSFDEYFQGQPSSPVEGVPRVVRRAVPGAVTIIVDRYNHLAYEQASILPDANLVAPGLAVIGGPTVATQIAPPGIPVANSTARGLIWVVGLVTILLLAAGGGWAIALLPSDPIVRVGLAPGLGAAAVSLIALVWDRIGLGFGTHSGVGPLLLAGLLGWGLAGARWRFGGKAEPEPGDEG
jgi:hypothetical protein